MPSPEPRGGCSTLGAMTEAPPERIDGRSTRHAHRRPELLAAATDYVFEHGLANLSIRPLASALGISHRAVLHHFGSKEQLVAEILHELRERDRRIIAAEASELRSGDEDPILVAWRRMSDPAYHNYWRSYFEVFGIAMRDPEHYGSFLEGIVSEWLELLGPLLIEEGCDPEEAEPIASLLLASFRGLYIDMLVSGDRARVDRAAADLARGVRLLIAERAVGS
jgi:AcrR family transcriptional regulator